MNFTQINCLQVGQLYQMGTRMAEGQESSGIKRRPDVCRLHRPSTRQERRRNCRRHNRRRRFGQQGRRNHFRMKRTFRRFDVIFADIRRRRC